MKTGSLHPLLRGIVGAVLRGLGQPVNVEQLRSLLQEYHFALPLADSTSNISLSESAGGNKPVAQKKRRQQVVVGHEDDEVGRNLHPRDNHDIEVYAMLRHQMGIHEGYKVDGCPHYGVEHVLSKTDIFEKTQIHKGKSNILLVTDKTFVSNINHRVVLFSEKL